MLDDSRGFWSSPELRNCVRDTTILDMVERRLTRLEIRCLQSGRGFDARALRFVFHRRQRSLRRIAPLNLLRHGPD